MGIGPRTVVDPVPLEPPSVGSLVGSALDPIAEGRDEQDGDWQNGFEYLPEACGEGRVADPCDYDSLTHDPVDTVVEVEPWVVEKGLDCSALSFGNSRDRLAERARRALVACESALIANEFWTGTQAQESAWPNRRLASPESDVLTAGATTPTDALACLEEGLRSLDGGRCGNRGMIHATANTVTHWTSLNLVRREGGLLLTTLGTIVIADAGYDGSGPDGQAAEDGSIWAYATDLVEVRRGPIDIVPSDLDHAVDRDLNTVEVAAKRIAAASWDGCSHFAVEIDLDVCDFAGPGS